MNKLISIYINNGVSLFEQGENTVIIPIELSNDIIDILEYLNFFILGGDLYKKNNNKFEHTYDNWYYEKQDPTIDSRKSIFQTEKYISNYVKDHGEYYYFSIVLDNEEFNLWLIDLENILQSALNQASNMRNHVIIKDSDLFLEKGYLFNF